jgi:putative ABC transport system permease protein
MLRHYFIITYRNILRNKSTFFINLIGLSTGMACALLIYLWLNDELHVDKFHEKDNRLYQVLQNSPSPNGIMTHGETPGILAKALSEEMPEIEYAVSVIPISFLNPKGILSNKDKSIVARGLFVGKDYFNVFSYQLIQGNKDQVLADKNNIAISKNLALKLFNTTESIIGKTIEWNQSGTNGHYLISGIFENPPSNSTSQFDLLLNYELFLEKKPDLNLWQNSYPSTFIVLKENTDLNQFNGKLSGFVKTKNDQSKDMLFLQKYSERYLNSKYENGAISGGKIAYVKLFSMIAVFILIIACINFMNLSTAKASKRLKEVGVKKAIGANRIELIIQYLGESMTLSFIALLIAICIVLLLLPQFSEITGKHISMTWDANVILFILCITLFTGFISGSYPALYLSGFNPVKVLKGKIKTSIGELWVRKGLVIFQFTISIIFIVSVLVVYKQMELVQTKNLGYNRDNIIYFEKNKDVSENTQDDFAGVKYKQNLDNFLHELKNIPGVVNVTNFRHIFTAGEHGSTTDLNWQGKNQNEKISFANLNAGYDFIETLGIEMKEGRSFSRNYGTEKSSVIFNETAIQQMGLKNPIGKMVYVWGEERKIIGVVKNFCFESLYENNTKPLFLNFSMDESSSKIMVKIKAGIEKETINRLKKFYEGYNHGLQFDFKFLDDDYQELYESENRVAALSKYFAGITIIISCLGLFGLVTFTAERRRKEIGLRKLLGSEVISIVYLLSSDFTKLVLVSIFIGLPVSYIITLNWLNSFAYRINISWWIFVLSGGIALLIAFATVSIQAIKAAIANPVDSLRCE